jgi:hypothetical protein
MNLRERAAAMRRTANGLRLESEARAKKIGLDLQAPPNVAELREVFAIHTIAEAAAQLELAADVFVLVQQHFPEATGNELGRARAS